MDGATCKGAYCQNVGPSIVSISIPSPPPPNPPESHFITFNNRQLACDMNINNTLALQNTKMVKTYCAIDPRVRPLAMAIKHWTRQRALNDAGKLAHFILYITFIMYL